MKHINAMNVAQMHAEKLRNRNLSPVELSILHAQWQRLKRRAERLHAHYLRNKSYPYSSDRQLGIRGINHPSIFWSGKVAA